ncbi:MAG: GGDEF domain-containing protein [Lachnospiraceae bacterium]|nr:GGDEF domain-containing protein [Lachnospiraceae bacterium]
MNRRNDLSVMTVITIVIIVALLLILEFILQVRTNREGAYQTADVLCDQIIAIIDNNDNKERALVESLKEDYITRAKAVAYIIDLNEDLEMNVMQLKRIANLISVDEIHLFDETGTIYSGTVPKYYGYSFDSGDQMAFFKPMLDNRKMAMCQDVTPNTAESKAMMYAICWNDSSERMIQIGIEPLRLLEELRSNEIHEVVAGMPSYDGVDILISGLDDGIVVGATRHEWLYKKLDDLGIVQNERRSDKPERSGVTLNTVNFYCSSYITDKYNIIILNDANIVNKGIPLTLFLTFLYLMLASVVILFIVRRMTGRILVEKENAITDAMTGYLNRRAYEDAVAELDSSEYSFNLTYVSLDLNGLKRVNDTKGHDAGDDLIRGAAECIRRCFGGYGDLYRIGGDEFAAIIYADKEQLSAICRDFRETTAIWSLEHEMELAVSCGCSRKWDHPEMTVSELAKEADKLMYDDKATYYADRNIDRRRHS